jgi:hypothetical protein
MKYNSYLLFLYLIIFFTLICCSINHIEGYQSTYNAEEHKLNVNVNDNSNESSEYSKTVDLPLTFPFSCKNFCGPGNTCAITGEQCSDDYDCSGCENVPKLKPPKVDPYYKELSPNNEQMDYVYVGSKNNLTPLYYTGGNEWIKSFNEGIKIYNRKELFNNPLDDFEKKIVSNYPMSVSATGQYYETTAPAYNQNFK